MPNQTSGSKWTRANRPYTLTKNFRQKKAWLQSSKLICNAVRNGMKFGSVYTP